MQRIRTTTSSRSHYSRSERFLPQRVLSVSWNQSASACHHLRGRAVSYFTAKHSVARQSYISRIVFSVQQFARAPHSRATRTVKCPSGEQRTIDSGGETRFVPREERARGFDWDRSADHIRARSHNGYIQRCEYKFRSAGAVAESSSSPRWHNRCLAGTLEGRSLIETLICNVARSAL